MGDADDAQGYGRFYGAGGMAILSRFPIMENEVEDYTALLWRDLPDNIYPQVDGAPFGGAQVHAAQRLSSKGHWIVPVATPDHGTVRVMTFHAAPPFSTASKTATDGATMTRLRSGSTISPAPTAPCLSSCWAWPTWTPTADRGDPKRSARY